MLITVSDSQHFFMLYLMSSYICVCIYIYEKKFMYKHVFNCFYNMIRKASFSQHL